MCRIWLLFIALGGIISEKIEERGDILQHLSKCEYEALKLGTDFADIINSAVGSDGWERRTRQEFIKENLGFSPADKNKDGVHKSSGEHRFSTNKSIEDGPYRLLNHKWIYMYGDSTTRQVWSSFAAPFQSNSFERNAKEWTRHYCAGQKPNRISHPKNGVFPEEGWRGPCGLNEVTCHVSGYGSEGLLTYDWKHFPYEDYDEYLWSDRGPWKANVTENRPDVLTVQFGLHTCMHSHESLHHKNNYTAGNNSMIEAHIASIPKLMKSIREAIDRPGVNRTKAVIIVTSGACGLNKAHAINDCVERFNRATSEEAHRYGFAVLDRGEIERRLMHKSLGSATPLVKLDTHLGQPAQSIIATCLLKILTCLEEVNYDIYSPDVESLVNIKTQTEVPGANYNT